MEKHSCSICPRHCRISQGQTGFCGGRICIDGEIKALNYGKVTAMALDPIEKKPLKRFFPGSRILSIGSFGCNLRCPFCQNHSISMAGAAMPLAKGGYEEIEPERLVSEAASLAEQGNIGLAYTYNEPLIGYEFVRDCAGRIRRAGMKNVLVSNGYICEEPWRELLPFIDGVNIDLKSFNPRFYEEVGGDLETVKSAIVAAAQAGHCHLEITTLIIPGKNDSIEEMEELSRWVSRLDRSIPLHVSRFFPRFEYSHSEPTPVDRVYKLVEIAAEYLEYVYPGNC